MVARPFTEDSLGALVRELWSSSCQARQLHIKRRKGFINERVPAARDIPEFRSIVGTR